MALPAPACPRSGVIGGDTLCFLLDGASACPRMTDLCGGNLCTYAVYDSSNQDCCPVTVFNTP